MEGRKIVNWKGRKKEGSIGQWSAIIGIVYIV